MPVEFVQAVIVVRVLQEPVMHEITERFQHDEPFAVAVWRLLLAIDQPLQFDFQPPRASPDISILARSHLADDAFEHGEQAGDGVEYIAAKIRSDRLVNLTAEIPYMEDLAVAVEEHGRKVLSRVGVPEPFPNDLKLCVLRSVFDGPCERGEKAAKLQIGRNGPVNFFEGVSKPFCKLPVGLGIARHE